MDKRDRLIRHTDVLSRNATRPLREPVAGPAVRAGLESVLGLLADAIERLEPIIELLYHACQKLRLPVPGVGEIEIRHRRTRKGNEVVVYLVKALPGNAGLSRRVQVAVFRFYDAEGGHREGQVALDLDAASPQLVAQLRLKLYYLMHYHVDFADEPLLSQLFPGPNTVRRAEPPASNADRMRRKARFEAALANAEALYYQVQPRMTVIGALVKALDEASPISVKDMLSPESRMVRLLAFRLGDDQVARELLRTAQADYAALEAALERARADEDETGLDEAAFPLSGFPAACRRHPALRELFPGVG